MSTPLVSQQDNLFDFFHSAVDTAVHSKGANVSEDGVFYLSNLLVERGRASETDLPQTLVELQIRAREEGGAAAVGAWRELGDRALYMSGFFRASLHRKNVSVEYYLSMGSAAYQQLATALRWSGAGGGFEHIYEELAGQFETCSAILQRVRDAVRAHSNSEILKLYEQWLATGDPLVADRLSKLGVVPMRPGDSEGGC
ncbi:MAG: hypothetical protein ACPGTU_08505 [Myxococcota bacterium]